MFSTLLSIVISNLLYFALHLDASSSYPKPLSAKQEKAYFEAMASGDSVAHNKLIEHNLRLVAHIIKKYYSKSNEQEDLISIGTIGLIKAVENFDFTKGTRFATFGAKCIENEILMYFRSQKKTLGDVSFSDPIDTDKNGNALTLMDIIADDCIVEDLIDNKLKSEVLYKLINEVLTSRERQIICARYGLGETRRLTQSQIAKRLNISRSYVSRIEKKALETLKKHIEIK